MRARRRRPRPAATCSSTPAASPTTSWRCTARCPPGFPARSRDWRCWRASTGACRSRARCSRRSGWRAKAFRSIRTCGRRCASRANACSAQPEIARNFLGQDGAVPALGAIIRQPELAATLELLATRAARRTFYHGALAARLVAGVRAQGGNWTAADLAGYRVVERAADRRPLPRRAHRVGAAAEQRRHRAHRGAQRAGQLRVRWRRCRATRSPAHRGLASRAARPRGLPRRPGFRARAGRAAHQHRLCGRPRRLDPHRPRDAAARCCRASAPAPRRDRRPRTSR